MSEMWADFKVVFPYLVGMSFPWTVHSLYWWTVYKMVTWDNFCTANPWHDTILITFGIYVMPPFFWVVLRDQIEYARAIRRRYQGDLAWG